MKILFVLSQIEVTGAETYALALASALRALGHEVVFVSDKLRDARGFKFYSVPLHARNTSYPGRIRNVFELKRIIKQEKIELIHSHSRAANLVSFFAARRSFGGNIPMAVSVHGRWRNHFAARALPCLGEATVAVCPYLARYLVEDIKIPAQKIHMVPNGIETDVYSPNATGGSPAPTVLYIGRFSGQKGNVIRYLLKNVFQETAKDFPGLRIWVVPGGSESPAELVEKANVFNQAAGSNIVEVLPPGADLIEAYRGASVVVGSGRVAMEGMACGRPVVTVGESSAPGLLTEQSFEAAFDSNFGDCGEWNLFQKENHLAEDLKKVLSDPILAHSLGDFGRKKALEIFDAKEVAKKIEPIYRSLLKRPSK